MKRTLFTVLGAFIASMSLAAVDVTVNSTQAEVPGSNYQTINAALTYAAGQTAPRTIRITGGGPYTENLMINFSVSIEGDAYRPTIVATPTSGGVHSTLNGNAISIYTDTSSGGDIAVHLENMIILPDTTTAPTRGIRSNNNATGLSTDNMTVSLVDVLITSNNGSNLPVTTDGLSQADLTGATIWGDDGIFITGYADFACTGTIISNSYGNAASADGLVFYADTEGYTCHVGPGCVFSYMNRCGIQVANDGAIVRLKGTADSPVVIKGNFTDSGYSLKNYGLAMYSDNNGNAAYDYQLSYVQFLDNAEPAIGCAFVDDGQSVAKLTADHLAFVNNADRAIAVIDDLLESWVITDSTFVNNASAATPTFPQLMTFTDGGAGSSGSVTFIDSIIAGNGSADSTGGANSVEILAPALSVVFQNCDIPVLGPYKVSSLYTLGASVPPPTFTDSVYSDPMLLDVNNYASAQWLGVDNGAFATLGSGGGPLHGYGPFIGGFVITGAHGSWRIYE